MKKNPPLSVLNSTLYSLLFLLIISCSRNKQRKNKLGNNAVVFVNGTLPKLISRQFSFTEGPAVDSQGNIFFTDQPNDQIWKYSTSGVLTIFSSHSGRANGLYIDKAGNIVACADEKGELISFSQDGKMNVLLKVPKGNRLNGPNDLWIDAKGGIYFTDPYYERAYWKNPKPVKQKENVYYLPSGSNEPLILAEDLVKPNGIVGTPDGKNLYIADIGDNKTYKYEIRSDGHIANKKKFISMGGDGITLDKNGNLYLAGNGVTIFDPYGNKIAQIPIKEDWTGNVCFGGKDKKTLFITASGGIYTMQMLVCGVE
ncbi:MAG: SMP-30/gluconolactonase/LRE family protein [Ginsengibacter sp.]